MKKIVIILILNLLILTPIFGQTIARWYTSMGDFEIKMREDLTPITVDNFASLTNDNFYDGLIFHRIIDDFMIQDGDPLGTGYGGPGYTIPDELNPEIVFDEPGVIGMANAGPDTGGSQYFITLVPTTWLNDAHTAFGNVINGMDVVQAIGDVATDNNDHPVEDVTIDSIRIMTPQFFGIAPEENYLEIDVGSSEAFTMFSMETGLEFSWFVDDELMDETSDMFIYTFNENGTHYVRAEVSNGDYVYIRNWEFEVTGTPNEQDSQSPEQRHFIYSYPNPFNPETNIFFSLEEAATVKIDIFNCKGQLVRCLTEQEFAAGRQNLLWNGKGANDNKLSSGIYYFSLEVDGIKKAMNKCLLLK